MTVRITRSMVKYLGDKDFKQIFCLADIIKGQIHKVKIISILDILSIPM